MFHFKFDAFMSTKKRSQIFTITTDSHKCMKYGHLSHSKHQLNKNIQAQLKELLCYNFYYIKTEEQIFKGIYVGN